jgi:hypothetical protein
MINDDDIELVILVQLLPVVVVNTVLLLNAYKLEPLSVPKLTPPVGMPVLLADHVPPLSVDTSNPFANTSVAKTFPNAEIQSCAELLFVVTHCENELNELMTNKLSNVFFMIYFLG